MKMKIIVNRDNLSQSKNQPRELLQLIVDKFNGEVEKDTLLKFLNSYSMNNSKANSKTTFQFYFRSLILHDFIKCVENDQEVKFSQPKVDVLAKRKTSTSVSRVTVLEERIAKLEKLLEDRDEIEEVEEVQEELNS
jgi:hypothetical protein